MVPTMSRKFENLTLELDEELEEKLAWLVPNYSAYHILKRSLDARRRKAAPQFVYSVEVFGPNESAEVEEFNITKVPYRESPVLIVGSGPAGLFAALRLSERGIPCHLFEQGSQCDKRLKDITRFWRYGELSLRNNVGFGEGGAGLYSDGKLITRIKSPHIPYVMGRLVDFGAPKQIRYESNPHVGSDRIRRLIPVLRQRLLNLGCQIHFDTKVTEILVSGASQSPSIAGLKTEQGEVFHSERIILACGHSAEDMFRHLSNLGVHLEGKSFAVGLRIEHPQSAINEMQYRDYADHPKLEAANYKLAHTDMKSGIGVYSFCMCPGGYILSSGTSHQSLVSNGMSNYNRNSDFANAAIVASIDYNRHFGQEVMAGLNWRKQLEHSAWQMVQAAGGTKELPAQTLNDFFSGRSETLLKSSCPSGVKRGRLDQLMGPDLSRELKRGLENFERWMKGFIHPEAQLHGVESRTSCPLRITRHKATFQSLSHRGLYPTGEGAGYAGGITSAACDGVAVAEAIVQECLSRSTELAAPMPRGSK